MVKKKFFLLGQEIEFHPSDAPALRKQLRRLTKTCCSNHVGWQYNPNCPCSHCVIRRNVDNLMKGRLTA